MNELMIHVETAVRPLRITQGQRRRMREELLGHLQGIFEEERLRLGDDGAAVRAAIERFGPTDELSLRLRESLPWYASALSWIPLLAPVRSWPLSVWRVTISVWLTGILCWVIVGVPWCLFLVSNGKPPETAMALWLLLAAEGLAILMTGVGLIASMHGVFGQPKSPGRAVLSGVGGCCGMLLIHWALTTFVNPEMSPVWYLVPVLMPVLFVVLAKSRSIKQWLRDDERRGARTGEWEGLELAD